MVQQVGAAGVEGEVPQLVDQQQIRRSPGRQAFVQSVPRLTGDQVVDQVGRGREADAIAAQTGELADRVGEVNRPEFPGGSNR